MTSTEKHRVTLSDGSTVDLHPIDTEEIESFAQDLVELSGVAHTLCESLSDSGKAQTAFHLERNLKALSEELEAIALRSERIAEE
jgi:hypothetical protein